MTNMLNTIGNIGPVNLGVCASDWQFYASGVYDSSCCTSVNHDITVVGYGTDNLPYWIIKNRSGKQTRYLSTP